MSEEEMVDIIDENMNVEQAVLKTFAHQEGLLHKCVIGQVIDSQGRYLLVKQAAGRQDAHQYVCPIGGHVKSGESDEAALKREAQEEIGITDFLYDFVGKGIFNRAVIGRKENHYMLFYKIICDTEPVINGEDEDYQYFTEDALKADLRDNPKMFGNAFHYAVENFFPHLLL